MLQLPWIKLDAYGIPREEYYKSAYERAFVKTPIRTEEEEAEVAVFAEKLKEIDELYGSDDMKKKLFGKKAKKYKYTPVLRFLKLMKMMKMQIRNLLTVNLSLTCHGQIMKLRLKFIIQFLIQILIKEREPKLSVQQLMM